MEGYSEIILEQLQDKNKGGKQLARIGEIIFGITITTQDERKIIEQEEKEFV